MKELEKPEASMEHQVKFFWWKYFFESIFGENIFFENIFGSNILFKKNFRENIFLKNIFGKNIFDENIFGNNIFWGKGLHFPLHPLQSTPYIQLPPTLTPCLKLRGGDEGRTNELTDRTEHAMIVPFIYTDI